MKYDFEKIIKDGVEQAMSECELTIGMSLKEAVEKQIPKKPLETKLSSRYELQEHSIEEGKCPACGEKVIGNQFGYYCGSCGQALDWNDE